MMTTTTITSPSFIYLLPSSSSTKLTTHFSFISKSSKIHRNRYRLEIRAIKDKTKSVEPPPSAEDVTKKYGLEAGLWKIFSTKEDEEGKEKKSKGEEAKELLAKYGGAYLATSITLSLISFTLCYLLINAGVDVPALLQKDLLCYCAAEVKGIVEEKPWHYPSCTTCTTRPQYKASRFHCTKCDKFVETQTIRYRIELKVEDNTKSNAIFVLFDDEAKRLIGQSAESLHDSHQIEEEDDEDLSPVPSLMLNTFVGKEFLFKIKINEFNHGNLQRRCFTVVSILDKGEIQDEDHTPRSAISQKRLHSSIDLNDSSPQPLISRNTRTTKDLPKKRKKNITRIVCEEDDEENK